MRSVWIPKAGPPEVLEVRDGPDPVPRQGEVVVRVRASGVNFADVAARLGDYPDAPPFPCVVGYEVAGVVESAPGVTGLAPGERVVALTRFGGYAEAVAVPTAQVFPLPDALSFEQGAAIPVNYLTAVLMLRHFGNVQAGERVLIHAAAGGVGMAAIQLCRAVGAEVIGTASASKHAVLREHGVAHAIDYRNEDFETAVKRITGGRGVDVVLDATGAFRKSYRCLAPLGRLVCFGFSAAATGLTPNRLAALPKLLMIPWFHPVQLMNANKAVIGVNLGHLWDRIEMLRREMLALLADAEAGRIAPVVGKTFPLAEAAAAHRYIQERRNVGKVLLTAKVS
jgi:NADPH:quinone reductase-like Zn-dependent oxidoreductase